jgi:hypothetical protein
VLVVQSVPVGYQVLRTKKSTVSSERIRDAVLDSRLKIQRFGESSEQSLVLASRETAAGQVLRVESQMISGQGSMHQIGQRQGDTLVFQPEPVDGQQSWSLTIPENCGGFFAVEWSLQEQPLRPGEARRISAVLPLINRVGNIELTAVGWEPTELLDETRTLLRIEQNVNSEALPAGILDSTIWMDERGEIQKVESKSLAQTAYRVDQQTAVSLAQGGRFDLGTFSTVKLAQAFENPHETRQARYRVRVARGNPEQIFPATPSQQVTAIDPQTAELLVTALRPDTPAPGNSVTDASKPTARDREASEMVQLDAASIQALLPKIPVSETASSWERAKATERFVHDYLVRKDYTTAFASAAEVAESRAGDCTEHAVLLTALCRAQKIPARAVFGLVYAVSEQGFAFHMWNEVWIENQWIPLDATLGQGGTGAAHLILGRSSLSTGNGFADLMPVIQLMGQLTIELVDATYE